MGINEAVCVAKVQGNKTKRKERNERKQRKEAQEKVCTVCVCVCVCDTLRIIYKDRH